VVRFLLSGFLALVYLVCVTPVGVVLRLFRTGPLSPETGRAEGTYWRSVVIDSDDAGQYTRYY